MTYYVGPQLSEGQRQVLHGTILGGSSLVWPGKGRNCYLAMRDRDRDWLLFKASQMSGFFKEDSLVKRDNNTFRCYSIAYPVFNETYQAFYGGGRKAVSRQILEGLNDLAWMVWFVDAGRKSKRKAYLRTHRYGSDGTELIGEYFNSLDCPCRPHLCRGHYELVFENAGAANLLKIVGRRLPKFMVDRYE